MRSYFWFNFVDAGIIFILLTLSLSHFLLWIGRKRVVSEKGNLYFSLATLALALFCFQRSLWPGLLIAKRPLHQHFNPTVEGILFFACFVGITRYLKHLTNWHVSRRYLTILTWLAALVPAIVAFSLAGLVDYRFTRFYRAWVMIPMSLYSAALLFAGIAPFLAQIVKKKIYRDPFHLSVMLGTVYILAYLYGRMIYYYLHQTPATECMTSVFYNWQLIIPTLLFSYALSRKHNNDFMALQELRLNLENKVHERTQQLEDAQSELELMNRQSVELFQNLAHETRTPLTLIQYHLERFSSRHRLEGDPDFALIAQNIGKLHRDMTNYLDSQKLESRSDGYNHRQKTDITKLVGEKGTFFGPFARDKGLVFQCEVQEGLVVNADPLALDRIVNNLVMNAIKYTDEGSVAIALSADDAMVKLTVRDTGHGLDRAQLDAIRHGKKPETSAQGYGIGLPLTRYIIEDMRGTLRVESEKERGSLFEVLLRRCADVARDAEDPQAVLQDPVVLPTRDGTESSTADSGNEREPAETILVVEDHPDLLAMLARELSAEYRVVQATNGEEALKRLSTMPVPALILSDLMMDVMDGETFFSIIRDDERYAAIPFVFLSAASAVETRIRVLKGGALEFIPKPFAIAELKARLHSLIRFSQTQRESMVRGAIELLNRNLLSGSRGTGEDRHNSLVRRCEELGLSERQREVTLLVADGLEYKEIAGRMNISERTVIRHVQNLYDKLGVHNKVELINRLNSPSERTSEQRAL